MKKRDYIFILIVAAIIVVPLFLSKPAHHIESLKEISDKNAEFRVNEIKHRAGIE